MSISPYPPEPVRFPVMLQNWESLTFLHWPYSPDMVRRMVPASLTLDTFNGVAWIGLTPFLLTGMRAPFTPAMPWLSAFPETNVRTYVIGRGGHHGVWFFSLDAARLAAVVGARVTYALPYKWSRMTVTRDNGRIHYSAQRRWPDRGAAYDIHVTAGPEFAPAELTDFDHFLTARYRLYTTIAGRLAYAQIEHPPWSLCRARVESVRQSIVESAGLPSPSGAPYVHHSRFLSVRIGRPRLV